MAAFLVATLCATLGAEPSVTLSPGTGFATSVAVAAEPAAQLTRAVVEAVDVAARPSGRTRLSVRVKLTEPRPGPGRDVSEGWVRAVDEAGLTHLLSSPHAWPDAPGAPATFQADLPASARQLTLLFGAAPRIDLALRVDLERRSAVAARIPTALPVPSWPELERLCTSLLSSRSRTLPLFPRATFAFPGRPELSLLVPAVQLVPGADGQRTRLAVVRVFVNRGARGPGELPRDVWFSDDGGDVAEPAQAYLVAAPAFGTYLDVVDVALSSVPERGHLFFGRLQEGALEVLGQVRLDVRRRTAHPVRPVEGRALDGVDGKPLVGAQVTLKGATDWRPDRSVVHQAVTGPEGRFGFPRVEPGRYVLETRQEAYLRDQRDLVQAAEATRVDVKLSPVPPFAGYIGVRLRRHDRGIIVEEVVRHSGAERAGILPGDRIVSVGGERVTTMERIHELIPGKPGTRARLRLERKGRLLDVAATRTPLLKDGSNEAP